MPFSGPLDGGFSVPLPRRPNGQQLAARACHRQAGHFMQFLGEV